MKSKSILHESMLRFQKAISFSLPSFSLFFSQVFLFSLLFFLSSSCSKKGTEPENNTVTFSGKVTLEGQTDHSGVTIALYKPVELDTALVRINQQYPNIGVQISQETEFDHREYTPVVTTVSDANGNWKIENIAIDEYNIVLSKSDFFTTVLYKVSNYSGLEQSIQRLQILSDPIYNDFVFSNSKIYKIVNQAIFIDAKINSGVKILIEANIKFKNSIVNNTINGVEFLGGENLVSIDFEDINILNLTNIKIQTLDRGTRFKNVNHLSINSSTFNNCDELMFVNQVNKINIANNNFVKSTFGIELIGCPEMDVQKNIFKSIGKGIDVSNCKGRISNNYFGLNEFGFVVHHNDSLFFSYNDFENNSICSLGIYGAYAEIFNNSFSGDAKFYVSCNSEYEQPSRIQPSVIIRNNNFLGSLNTVAVNLLGNSYLPGDVSNSFSDIEAINNYWNTIIELSISDRIIDINDNPMSGEVKFIPFSGIQINSAGIQ